MLQNLSLVYLKWIQSNQKMSLKFLIFIYPSYLSIFSRRTWKLCMQKNLKTLYAEVIKLPAKFYKMLVLKIKEWNKQEEKGEQEHQAN